MAERAMSAVPKPALLLLALGLAMQLGWHRMVPPQHAAAGQLGQAPGLASLRLASLGEPIALSKLLMFYVQSSNSDFGDPAFADLEQWLGRVSDLDPRAQYPLLAASRVYGEVSDPVKQRVMLEFVYRRFMQDPNRRWAAMAHVTMVAKHRLKDLPLALRYARAMRQSATGPQVPSWVKQMEVFVLEDMRELDSAKILLGALLESGQISDPQERRFLLERLKQIESGSRPK